MRRQTEEVAAGRDPTPYLEKEEDRDQASVASAVEHVKAGNLLAALDIARDLDSADGFIAIAKAQIEEGEFAAARETADEIKRAGDRIEMLWEIAEARARAGKVDAARVTRTTVRMAIAEDLQDWQSVEWGWQWEEPPVALAIALARTGALDAALRTVVKIRWERGTRETGRRAAVLPSEWHPSDQGTVWYRTLIEIVTALIEDGGWTTAQEIFARLRELVQEVWPSEERRFQEEIMAVLVRRMEFAAALEVAQGLQRAKLSDESQLLLAAALARTGAGEEARLIFANILEETEELNLPDKSETLRHIAAAQALAGDFASALGTARKIEELGLRSSEPLEDQSSIDVIDAERYANVLIDIAAAHAQAGDQERARSLCALALEVVEKTKDAQEADDRPIELDAGQLARAREFALAHRYAVETQYIDDDLIKQIGAAQVRAGQLSEAREMFFGEGKIQAVEENVRGGRELFALDVAGALAEAGDREIFQRLLIPCAYSPAATSRMCGLLAQVYPKQAEAIAGIVLGKE